MIECLARFLKSGRGRSNSVEIGGCARAEGSNFFSKGGYFRSYLHYQEALSKVANSKPFAPNRNKAALPSTPFLASTGKQSPSFVVVLATAALCYGEQKRSQDQHGGFLLRTADCAFERRER
eukprot:69807-Rhodomonas_salina.4